MLVRSVLLALALLAMAGPAHAAFGPVGALDQLPGADGCIDEYAAPPCRDGRAFTAGYTDVALGADGRAMVVPGVDSLAVLRRDPATGVLTQSATSAGCVAAPGNKLGCRPAPNLGAVAAVAFSPDGRHVYAAGSRGIAAFDYVADAQIGGLVPLPGATACYSNDGTAQPGNVAGACTNGRALSSLREIVVSPDGEWVYAVTDAYDAGSDGVVVLARDEVTGALTQPAGAGGCVTVARAAEGDEAPALGCGGELRAGVGPTHLAVSPDGATLYLATEAGVIVLRRNARGTWHQPTSPQGCVTSAPQTGCTDGRALQEPRTLAVSPDGASVYLANYNIGELAHLRATAEGLTQLPDASGCLTIDGARPADGIGTCTPVGVGSTTAAVGVSPDGVTVAVTGGGSSDESVVLLDREADSGALAYRGCVSSSDSATDCLRANGFSSRAFAWSPGGEHFYGAGGYSVGFLRREVAPRCADTSVVTDSLTPVTIAFPCTDLNGDAVSLVPDEQAALTKGTATLEGTSARFEPFAGASGQDRVVVRPRDASGNLGAPAHGIVDITLRTTPVAIQPPPPPAGRAPLPRALTRTLRPDRRRRMRFALACPASAPVECAGRLVIRTVKVRTSRRGKRRVVQVASLAYDIAPGKTARLSFRATKAVRRVLKARRLTGLIVRVSSPAQGVLTAATAVSRAQLKR